MAVEERLRLVLDGLREAANIRVDCEEVDWACTDDGLSMFHELQRMRKEEERALDEAVEKRLKKQNENKERGRKENECR